MREADMAQFLTEASAIDFRQVTPLMVTGWMHAIGDLELGECQQALAVHRRTSTEYLLPAHIHDLVKAARAEGAREVVDLAVEQRRAWLTDNGIDVGAWEAGDPAARRAARAARDRSGVTGG